MTQMQCTFYLSSGRSTSSRKERLSFSLQLNLGWRISFVRLKHHYTLYNCYPTLHVLKSRGLLHCFLYLRIIKSKKDSWFYLRKNHEDLWFYLRKIKSEEDSWFYQRKITRTLDFTYGKSRGLLILPAENQKQKGLLILPTENHEDSWFYLRKIKSKEDF